MNWSSVYEMRGSADLWWFNKANDLRGAAAAISHAIKHENPDLKKEAELGDGYSFSIALPGVFSMNAGLSIELLLKAILVINSKGKFEDLPHSHNLTKLAEAAGVYNLLNKSQKDLLEVFSEFIYWAGKYPVAKTHADYIRSGEIMQKRLEQHSSGNLTFYKSNPKTNPSWENYNDLWNVFASEYWKKYEVKHGT